MNTGGTNSVTRLIKALVFSCVGGTIATIVMLAAFIFVVVKLIGISQRNDELVRNLPEVTGVLTTGDSVFISPIGKKPSSLVVFFVTYKDKIRHRRSRDWEHNTFIFPEKLRFRVGEKNYVIQRPEDLIYLRQRADLYFPDLHQSDDFRLDRKRARFSPFTIDDQKIPPGLLGHDPFIDCILQDLASEEGPCAKTYSTISFEEYYYEPNETVTLKGKIEGDKFLLFDITASE
jgi:hypothetical protein